MGFDLRKTMSDFFTGIANGLLDWNFQVDDGANEKPKRAKGYTEKHTKQWLDSVKPTNKWTKVKIKKYMDGRNIKYNSGDTKLDLLQKIEWSDNV